MNLIILDTETASLNGALIELAWLNPATKETFEQRYNPDCKISAGAMAVHHITDADVANMPLHTTVSIPQVDFVVGHNIDYDIETLNRSGIDTSNIKAICTLALARKAFPELESHSIGALMYALFDQEFARNSLKNAHSALADVENTRLILNKIIEKMDLRRSQLFEASEQARIPTHMHFGKHKGLLIAELPSDYVRWLLSQDNVDPYLRKSLTQ